MFAPSISVQPNFFTTYVSWIDSTPRPRKHNNGLFMPLTKLTHGLISQKANKRIRRAIDWLIAIAKDKELGDAQTGKNYIWRLNFVTLTLCAKQRHSDKVIKESLLNQFLTELRTKYGCKHYVWRAEAQANGNIHFHVVTDVYIPWRTLRTDWNRIQQKLGYVDDFEIKHRHRDPNSTDVHSTKKIRNLSAYLAKYCGKNTKGYVMLATQAQANNPTFAPFKNITHHAPNKKAKIFRQIHGNLWGLSQTLSKLKAAQDVIDYEIEEEINFVTQNYPEHVKFFDFARVFLINFNQAIDIGLKRIPQMLLNYCLPILQSG